jgi:hypothetical protein
VIAPQQAGGWVREPSRCDSCSTTDLGPMASSHHQSLMLWAIGHAPTAPVEHGGFNSLRYRFCRTALSADPLVVSCCSRVSWLSNILANSVMLPFTEASSGLLRQTSTSPLWAGAMRCRRGKS